MLFLFYTESYHAYLLYDIVIDW